MLHSQGPNLHNLGVSNSITYLDRTPIFEWYVVWCSSKNGYQKDVFKEIGLHAQNTRAILDSTVNKIGGPIWPFEENENLHLDNESNIHTSSKTLR